MKKSITVFLKNAHHYFAHHSISNCKIIERGEIGGQTILALFQPSLVSVELL
jgi:hypothetical protein